MSLGAKVTETADLRKRAGVGRSVVAERGRTKRSPASKRPPVSEEETVVQSTAARAAVVEPVREPPKWAATSPEDLLAVPLFTSLSGENLAELARTIVKQRAAAGETLCREGEYGEQMYVILRGVVTVCQTCDGHETEIGRLESGAYFGEMALIGDAPRTATIAAATDIEYLAVDRKTLMRVIAAHPTVALQILKGYNSRLAETTQKLTRLTAHQVMPSPRPDAVGPEEAYRQAVELTVARAPYPIASLARKMQVERAWDRKLHQALDVFEAVVKYTVLVLLSDYLQGNAGRTPQLDQMIAGAFRKPTLGQLLELSARLLRSYSGREHELFMPELYRLYFSPEGGRAPTARAYQALTTYRNRLKHGAEGVREEEGFRTDFEGGQQGSGRGTGIKHHLATVLRDVGFLGDYPLVYPTSMTYEEGSFQYSYERCTGAYSDFDHGIFVYREPLDSKRLYVLSERDGRVLRLDPLVRRLKCPDCGQARIFILFNFFPDKERAPRANGELTDSRQARRREKLEYLSYSCGHTIADQLSDERRHSGEGLSRLLASAVEV